MIKIKRLHDIRCRCKVVLLYIKSQLLMRLLHFALLKMYFLVFGCGDKDLIFAFCSCKDVFSCILLYKKTLQLIFFLRS